MWANDKGTYFPEDIVGVINNFLAGNPITVTEFQQICNVLPEDKPDDNVNDPDGSVSATGLDDSKVCFLKSFEYILLCFNS